MRRIDRYLLTEIVVPALVGGVIVVMLLVGNQLYALLRYLYQGVPVRAIFLTLAYFSPGVLMMAIPAALLLGASLALNRLERDRELLSMRMAGVRLKRVILPLLLLGLLGALLMFYLQEYIIPYTTHQALLLSQQLAYGSPVSLVQRDTMFKVQSAGSTYFIYVRDADPNPLRPLLRGIVVAKIDDNSTHPPTWVTIPQAINRNGAWLLQSDPISHVPPRFYIIPLEGDAITGTCGDGEWLIPRDAFNYFYDQRTTPDEYTLAELLNAQRHRVSGSGASPGLNAAIILNRQTIPFYVQRKFAAPLAALVAILIAIPLSIHFGRSGGYVGLLLSVVIAFVFVISQQWMQILAERNYLPPVLAAWTPNLVFGLLGLILLFREE